MTYSLYCNLQMGLTYDQNRISLKMDVLKVPVVTVLVVTVPVVTVPAVTVAVVTEPVVTEPEPRGIIFLLFSILAISIICLKPSEFAPF